MSISKFTDPQNDLTYSANVKYVQKNLISAIGLPKPFIDFQNQMKSRYFFGIFGSIERVRVSTQDQNNQKYTKKFDLNVFVTYKDELSASLAFLALDN